MTEHREMTDTKTFDAALCVADSRGSMRASQFHVALLPLAVLSIVMSTMVPIDLRARIPWDGHVDALDTLLNLLLFAPLGVALCQRRWWVIAGMAGALSLCAEVLQMWAVGRFPSPYDVVSNVLGALLAALVYRQLRGTPPVVTVVVNGWRLLGASLMALLLMVLWYWPRPATSLAAWDAEYSLLVGNERTGDRPWKGTVADLTLLGRALSAAEVEGIGRAQLDARARHGTQVIYSAARPLRVNGTAHELPPEAARRMVSQVAASNAFTVMARITVLDVQQQGPARIISFSRDTLSRNFDLGQHYDHITLRVRNAVSGANGEDYRAETPAVLRPGVEALVVATYDGAVARIYLDGAMVARANFAAVACPVSAVCDEALPLGWWLIGLIAATLALALLLSIGPKQPAAAAVVMVCLAAAIACELLLPPVAGSHAWHRYLAWIGALTVVVARVPAPRA